MPALPRPLSAPHRIMHNSIAPIFRGNLSEWKQPSHVQQEGSTGGFLCKKIIHVTYSESWESHMTVRPNLLTTLLLSNRLHAFLINILVSTSHADGTAPPLRSNFLHHVWLIESNMQRRLLAGPWQAGDWRARSTQHRDGSQHLTLLCASPLNIKRIIITAVFLCLAESITPLIGEGDKRECSQDKPRR